MTLVRNLRVSSLAHGNLEVEVMVAVAVVRPPLINPHQPPVPLTERPHLLQAPTGLPPLRHQAK